MKAALLLAPGWSREMPPISLALLTASLRSQRHEVFPFDLNNEIYLRCKQEYNIRTNGNLKMIFAGQTPLS